MDSHSESNNLGQNSFNGSEWSKSSREHRNEQIRNHRGRDVEYMHDTDYRFFRRFFRRKTDKSPVEDDKIIKKDILTQLVEESSSAHKYNTSDSSFVDNNRCTISMIPPVNIPCNNSMNFMAVSQSDVTLNQSSAMIPMLSALEIIQASNLSQTSFNGREWSENSQEHRYDQIRNHHQDRVIEYNHDRDESCKTVTQMLPTQSIKQSPSSAYNYNATDHSFVDSSRCTVSTNPSVTTPWNNSMCDMTVIQNNMTMNQNSSVMPGSSGVEMVQISNLSQNSFNRNELSENNGDYRYDQVRNDYQGQVIEYNHNTDNSGETVTKMLPSQHLKQFSSSANNYNAAEDSFVGSNRCTVSIMPRKKTRWDNSVDGMTVSQSNITTNQSSSGIPMSSNLEMMPMSNLTVKTNETVTNKNMHGVIGMENNSHFGQMTPHKNTFFPLVKKNVQKTNVLHPPNPSAPHITTKNENVRCETVFFSGLAEKTTEEIIQLKNNVLYPPNPNAPHPSTGNKPVDSKTNFVSEKVLGEIIHLTKSVLYPPNPNLPLPPTKNKPLGCKTVFVSGFPEKADEEVIKEIFKRCGAIETIRMSKSIKRRYCHIRFVDELFVENAIHFSGSILKVENRDEALFTGRLLVDYSLARDDQYDYECKQRALQRQARHGEKDYYRAPTTPAVCYSHHEASLVCEKLKYEETFTHAASVLIHWLEKGECTKKTASIFFSMLQSTNNLVKNLEVDKTKSEEKVSEAKKLLKRQLERMIKQLTEIGKIYKAASLQKCWDHFTKAQRKNIEMWTKHTEEAKNVFMEEVINEREDEEMELSDDENVNSEKDTDIDNVNSENGTNVDNVNSEKDTNVDNVNSEKDTDVEQLKSQYNEHMQTLQEENDSLKCQLEAALKEITVMQKELLNLSQKHSENEVELKELRAFKDRIVGECNKDNDFSHDCNNTNVNSSTINLENDAGLIGFISTFLKVQPFGANVDDICSYLHQTDTSIKVTDVENLMKKFPTLFKEDFVGTGDSLVKKWKFIGS